MSRKSHSLECPGLKNHTTGEDIGIASPPNHWLRCGVFSFGAGVQRLGLVAAWFAVLAGAVAQSTNTPPEDAKPTTAKLPTRDRLEDELRWLRAEWVTVDTVQSASKYEQSVADAPASVTIITDDEIRRFGHRTLAEVLNSVRGFNLTYDRNYHYLGVRGFGRPGDFNSRVLMLVDGHRVNDVVYDGAAIGTDSPVPVDMIDRVEIVRGPGSSVYGSSAFFGVINIITKRGARIDGVEASTSAGGFGTYDGRFTYGKKFPSDLEVSLTGNYYNSAGPRSLLIPGSGVAQGVDHDSAENLLGSLRYKDLTLNGGFVTRTKQVPSGAFGTVFNDPRNQTRDDRGFANITYARKLDEINGELQVRSYYDRYGFEGIYTYPGTDQVLRNVGDRWGMELQYRQEIWERHSLTVGADFRHNLRLEQEVFTTPPYTPLLFDSRSSTIWSPYLEAKVALLTNLALHAGARMDLYSSLEPVANPRVALTWQPRETTALKLLYGSAFRAPTVYELYYADPTSKANPSLRPENIRTYELAWEQTLAPRLRLSASAYRYEIDNLTSQVLDPADGLLVYRNRESALGHGLETELLGWTEAGIRARVSYAFQNASDQATGTHLSNSPRHLGKFHLVVPLHPEKLALGTELYYTSTTSTTAGTPVSGYFLANVNLVSQKLVPNLELSAGIYNLLDKRYSHVVGDEIAGRIMPQDARSFRVKATYRF